MYYRSGVSNVFFSGEASHSVAEQEVFSFEVWGAINGPTGVAAIKFSGNSGVSSFTFRAGKIFDPEGRYVSSYKSRERFSLSGNMSGVNYDYYINNSPICFSGTKPNYKLQKFFIGVTGAEFSTERIALYSPPFQHQLDVASSFKVSGELTGLLLSTGEYASSKFEIFSGEIKNNDLFVVSGIETGPRTSSIITIATTGIDSGHYASGMADYENLYAILNLYTNFGFITKTFTAQAIPIETTMITSGVTDSIDTNFLISGTGEQKQSGIYALFYQVFENYRTYLDEKPLKISLDYTSGDTGDFYSFSGEPPTWQSSGERTGIYTGISGYISLSTSGSNYSSVPDVVFTGSGLKMSPITTVLMDLRVTGIDVTYSGSGYSSAPAITVSGGTPLVSGQATALTGSGLYSGMVTGITITNQGTGYNQVPSVTFSGTLYDGGVQASGDILMGLGKVTGIVLDNPGGYLGYQPGLSGITGGGSSGVLSGISVTNSGSGYASSPIIRFSGANRKTEAFAIGQIQITGAQSGLVTGILISNVGYAYESTPSISFTGVLYAGGYNATGTATLKDTVANATGFTISGYSKSFTGFWNLKTGESITGGLVDYTNSGYFTGQGISFMDTGHTNVTGSNYGAVLETSGRYNDSGAMYADLNFHIYSGIKIIKNITGIR